MQISIEKTIFTNCQKSRPLTNYYLLIEYKEQGFVLEMEEYYEFYKSEIFDSYHDFVDIIASFNTSDLFMKISQNT